MKRNKPVVRAPGGTNATTEKHSISEKPHDHAGPREALQGQVPGGRPFRSLQTEAAWLSWGATGTGTLVPPANTGDAAAATAGRARHPQCHPTHQPRWIGRKSGGCAPRCGCSQTSGDPAGPHSLSVEILRLTGRNRAWLGELPKATQKFPQKARQHLVWSREHIC